MTAKEITYKFDLFESDKFEVKYKNGDIETFKHVYDGIEGLALKLSDKNINDIENIYTI